MRTLLLDLSAAAAEQPAETARALAGTGEAWPFHTLDAALAHLDEADADFDLAVIGDDDPVRLFSVYTALSTRRRLLPIVIVSRCDCVETAITLIKAGAEDYVVRDAGGRWIDRLPEAAIAASHRSQARCAQNRLDSELRESQRRLAQIVDGSSVAMFVIDHRHRVTHWNRACEALTGIAGGDMVGTAGQWRAFYQHERPCMADLVVDGAMEARIAEFYGNRYRRSTVLPGTYEAEDFFPRFGNGGCWLFFTAAPLRDSQGRVHGAIETLQDMTAQKRAREALRESESFLRQIIQCSSVATFVINRDHEVTHWNRACEKLLGRSAAATVGTRRLAREVYGDDRPMLADLVLDGIDDSAIQRHYDGRYRESTTVEGVYEVEDRFPDLPGGERWIHFAAAPLRDDDGQTIGAIETLIDITERKRAERRIRDSEARLAHIVDGLAVATFVIDADHRITHWNRACAALTGLPAGDMVGTRNQWRAFYTEERPCMADLVLDGILEDQAAQYYRAKKFHRSLVVDGGYEAEDFFAAFGEGGCWLYFTAAPFHDADGKVIGAIETLQDITEQKRAEDHLRQSEERYRVLSITDGMTGLFNARHFAQRLREEMDRCQRYRHPLALMVLDVDNFKQFNDTWGHVQGDQVLIALAECISQCLRRTDQAFRYGGEEFVALLPETDLDHAEAAAERIRALFAGIEICPPNSPPVQCTVSIGVTAFVGGESSRDFVARADSGTYQAKREGRNRVIRIAPPTGR